MDETIIAIDPGREKCGIAVVRHGQGVLYQAVIPVTDLTDRLHQLMAAYHTTTIILGNGTAHHTAQKALDNIKPADKPLTVHLVDEQYSTEEARKRYWRHHPPKGLKRLIPTSMQVPPVPVDDYVAVILAERYFTDL